MKKVVITGSTKGIGFAMASEFITSGDKIVICSRSQSSVDDAVEKLFSMTRNKDSAKIFGTTCDVSVYDDVRRLGEFTIEKLGDVDYWINNAGTNAYTNDYIIDSDIEKIKTIINTNLLGTVLCCKEALRIMKPRGEGHIFNMEGLGSNGRASPGLATYGATKAGITYFTKTLIKETKGTGIGVHYLSPGMVLTDLY
jgi:chlorophyll(ide) b reductase